MFVHFLCLFMFFSLDKYYKTHYSPNYQFLRHQILNNLLKGAVTPPTQIFIIIGFWLLGITNFFLGVSSPQLLRGCRR